MAEAALQQQEQEEEQDQEQETQRQGASQASFLDPDVLIILPFAIIIDILDFLVIGVVANLVLGGFILAWMVWKTGKIESAREQMRRIQQAPQERMNFARAQQERLATRRAATRRVWRRGILYCLGGLVPVLSIFMLWTWAVIKTVRGK